MQNIVKEGIHFVSVMPKMLIFGTFPLVGFFLNSHSDKIQGSRLKKRPKITNINIIGDKLLLNFGAKFQR